MDHLLAMAKKLGFFDSPRFMEIRSQVPAWFIEMSSANGRQKVETEFEVLLSDPLRFYFSNPDLAAIIESCTDLNSYLNHLRNCLDSDPPYFGYHNRRAHMVIAFHIHSGGVVAADLSSPETVVRYGNIDIMNYDFTPMYDKTIPFDRWLADEISAARFDIDPRTHVFEVRQ